MKSIKKLTIYSFILIAVFGTLITAETCKAGTQERNLSDSIDQNISADIIMDIVVPSIERLGEISYFRGIFKRKLPKYKLSARSDKTTYRVLEDFDLTVSVNNRCYLYLFNVELDGQVKMVFPNRNNRDNMVSAGADMTIPQMVSGYKLRVSEDSPAGNNFHLVIASPYELPVYDLFTESFDDDKVVRGVTGNTDSRGAILNILAAVTRGKVNSNIMPGTGRKRIRLADIDKALLSRNSVTAVIVKYNVERKPEPLIEPIVEPGITDLITSSAQYDKSPMIADKEVLAQVSNNNQFAFDLYSRLKTNDANLFFSPFSISIALSMTYAGARGKTETQMAKALRFNKDHQVNSLAFNKINLLLEKQGEVSSKYADGGFKLNIANAIWAQQDTEWELSFLDQLKTSYDTGIYMSDFRKNHEQARLEINRWVEYRTDSRIQNLIQPGILNNQTRMVLLNAIYFYGQWLNQFQENRTSDGEFMRLGKSKVTVPMMNKTVKMPYMEAKGFKAAELEYNSSDISMLIILPDMESFKELELKISSDEIREITRKLKNHHVDLTIPKFKIDAGFELEKVLSDLGMPDAFGNNANFSGMNGAMDLFIQKVIHKAFIEIDEKGTEAAASTAVIMGEKGASMPQYETVEFKADHPFIFAIIDRQTDSILFLGRVMDPH